LSCFEGSSRDSNDLNVAETAQSFGMDPAHESGSKDGNF
jgi:hypothetical protein